MLLLDELHALGVAFVTLGEGIDATTPAGRLQLHVLAAIAEFERARVGERVRASLARAKAQGRALGRRRKTPLPTGVTVSVREAARLWGVSPATASRRLNRGDVPPGETNLAENDPTFATDSVELLTV